MSVAKAKCIDLLFVSSQVYLLVIPHPDIFFHGIIVAVGYIYGMVTAMPQTLSDHQSIVGICLYTFALGRQHCSRRQDNAVHTRFCKLVI